MAHGRSHIGEESSWMEERVKEAGCMNSRAILDYLSAHGVDYSGIIRDLDPEIDRQEDPERFLRGI